MVESNHRHLYVKQIRSHYANEAGLSTKNHFWKVDPRDDLFLYRVMVLSHSKVRYEPSSVPDHSVVLVDIDSSSILGFPPNPLR